MACAACNAAPTAIRACSQSMLHARWMSLSSVPARPSRPPPLPPSWSTAPSRGPVRSFGSSLGGQRGVKKPPQRSPLVDFQLDTREVKHMAPHVLAASVASAGAGRHSGEPLWRGYSERALELRNRFTLRDLKQILQGHADASEQNGAFFRELLSEKVWLSPEASPKDLCALAVAMAKLRFFDADIFRSLGAHLREHGQLQLLEPIDLASLANAFSRASCCDGPFFDALGAELKRRCSSSETLSPATATLALNAFAVCGCCEGQLFEVLLNAAVIPRVADFTVTQAALVVDATARCLQAVPQARSVFDAFAEHWLSTGMLEELASPEDLAHLVQAAVRLEVIDNDELNLALAAGALRQLGRFKPSQLAMFCDGIARLPSTGREAFLAAAASHVLPQVLRRCSLSELGQICWALAACDTPVPEDVAALLKRRVSAVTQEAVSTLAKSTSPGVATGSAVALKRLAEACMKLQTTSQGQQMLATLRPLALALCTRHQQVLGLQARATVLAAHAHFHVRDMELFEGLGAGGAPVGSLPSPNLSVRLLASLGTLRAPVEPLLRLVDSALLGCAGGLPLDAVASALFATASLGFQPPISAAAIQALLVRAKELCEQSSALAGSLEVAQIAAAASAWQVQVPDDADAVWLQDWAGSAATAGMPSMESPPQGLLREVFVALHRSSCLASSGCSIVTGQAVGPVFVSDLWLSQAPDGPVAVEVDGPRRFYHGTRDLLAVCELKGQAASAASKGRVLRIGFWEWPAKAEQQDLLLSQRLASLPRPPEAAEADQEA
ncbi:unnamed protein product [Polarella glacialis]|uniref:RNA-editing substrate-binding complex 6 protein domain-containing protein n=1 Tax=Polarella glacialis TaxID=89957 RepID=A0A813GRT1_POLGL|nr:unnamed protein product [Polarella glacialis]